MKIYRQPEKSIRQAVASGGATIAVCGLGKMGLPLATVFAYDPVLGDEVQRFGVISSDLGSGEWINEIDTILLASDHAGFQEIDWDLPDRKMRHKVVVDGRGILDPEELRLRGYLYRAVGQS